MILTYLTPKKNNKGYELAQKFVKWRKTKAREYQYLRKYNIDLKEFSERRKNQNNCCAICNKSFNEKKPHVDHNHFTLKVRGLLCINCNLGLGNFKDSISSLENAIKYLKENDE